MAQFHGTSVSYLTLPTEGFVAELVRELGDNWIVDATHYPDIAEWRIVVTHRPSKVGFEVSVAIHNTWVTAEGMDRRVNDATEAARVMREATRAYYQHLIELV